MNVFYFLLLLLAAVFFALSAFSVRVNKVNLLSLGLLCWVLVPLIQHARVL